MSNPVVQVAMPLYFDRVDPATPEALVLLDQLSIALEVVTGDSGRASFDAADVRGARALFLLARDHDGKPVGCGAFRPISSTVAEVKRMYAVQGGSGIGSRILAQLEAEAKAMHYQEIWLETRLVNQVAVRFYEQRGYVRIANYGKYIGNPKAVCFGKRLPD